MVNLFTDSLTPQTKLL